MLYVVALCHKDGRTSYAGNESWEDTKTPERVFTSVKSAQGCANQWKRKSGLPGFKNVNLKRIEIIEADVAVRSLIAPAKTITC